MKHLRFTAATLLALLAGAALAQNNDATQATAPATPRVDARQAVQDQRIEAGAEKGTLTRREQRRLELEQKGIARAETAAKADGTVTAQERQRLHRLQNQASRDIRRQKHDAQHVKPTAATAP